MIKGNQPTETLEENWPFACLLCHNCGERCKNTLCQISPLPSAAICGDPRSKEAKPHLKLQIDGHSYRQHIIQGRSTRLPPDHISLYCGFKESLGNAWIQTNGQEKLRDRETYYLLWEFRKCLNRQMGRRSWEIEKSILPFARIQLSRMPEHPLTSILHPAPPNTNLQYCEKVYTWQICQKFVQNTSQLSLHTEVIVGKTNSLFNWASNQENSPNTK